MGVEHDDAKNFNNPTPMQIFPKSGIYKSESGGIRVRGDGVRTRYSNSSFLLQKAQVLRRQIDINGTSTALPVLINDTDVNYDDNFNVSTLNFDGDFDELKYTLHSYISRV